MSTVLFEILAIFLLILVNGILAMAEISVVSARKIRLHQRAEAGMAGAQAALDLANKPDRFLSTVQIGITLIGILAGAFGGATVAEELEGFFSTLPVPWLAANGEAVSVALVVLVITYFSLVIGELAPKQIGLNNPEGIAAGIAPIMIVVSRVTAPVVHLLSFSSSLILRLLNIRPSTEPEVTEEEIKLMIEQGMEGGIFDPEEEEMVQQVFRLADRPIVTQMTYRTEIVWLDLDDPLDKIKATIAEKRYSYYPVARDSIDYLVGVVQAKNLLARCMQAGTFDLEEEIEQPLFIPEGMKILEALKRFRESRSQIAFILDEFGGIQGLTTLTDILEAIAGDFPDAFEANGPDIFTREDGTFLVDGLLAFEEFRDFFGMDELPGEEDDLYQTFGGFVITYLGRIPSVGDTFEFREFRMEIVDMDGLRVDKVLVSPK